MISNTAPMAERAAQFRERFAALESEIGKVIVGQPEIVRGVLTGLFVGGNILLEGVPGLGKTLLIRTLAQVLDLKFTRIQFTPDLMPSDIVGTDIILETPDGKRERRFQTGPLFSQIVLADEINRAIPKTQSAMLEAMQERTVSVGGTTHKLPEPFFVLATQNPIEQEGTYPLPEAQRDRFLFQTIVDYPTRDQESEIIERTTGSGNGTISSVVTGEEILGFQKIVRLVPLPEHVKQFVLDVVRSLRPKDKDVPKWVGQWVQWGPGPRACQQIVIASKARALLHGRLHVSTEDVEALAFPVLRHRIVPTFSAQAEAVDSDAIIARLLKELPKRKPINLPAKSLSS